MNDVNEIAHRANNAALRRAVEAFRAGKPGSFGSTKVTVHQYSAHAESPAVVMSYYGRTIAARWVSTTEEPPLVALMVHETRRCKSVVDRLNALSTVPVALYKGDLFLGGELWDGLTQRVPMRAAVAKECVNCPGATDHTTDECPTMRGACLVCDAVDSRREVGVAQYMVECRACGTRGTEAVWEMLARARA